MRNHLLTVAFALFAIALFASAQDAAVDQTGDSKAWSEIKRVDFDTSRGIHHLAAGIPIGGIVIYPLEQGTLGVVVACTTEILPEGDDLRVAFIDKDGKRHDARRNYGIGGPRGKINRAYLFVSPKGCSRQDVREVIFEQFKTVSADELADLQKSEEQRLAEYLKDSPLGIPIVGKPYPFKLTGLDGNEVSTDQWRGKVIIIDFWATWCGPCVAELPKLKKLYEEYHDRGLEVVGISSDVERDPLKEYVKDNDIRWPQVYVKDLGEKSQTALQKVTGVTSIPRYFVIDRDGNLHTARARGRLAEIIPKLLAK